MQLEDEKSKHIEVGSDVVVLSVFSKNKGMPHNHRQHRTKTPSDVF